MDTGWITAAITGSGLIGIAGGALLRPFFDRLNRRISERIIARIHGIGINGQVYLVPSYLSGQHLKQVDNLTAELVAKMDFVHYVTRVTVCNVKGRDIERLSLTIAFSNVLLVSSAPLEDALHCGLSLLKESVMAEGVGTTVSTTIEKHLAVADEAFVAQLAFFGPKNADYDFHWRVSANGMAHPTRGFGRQTLHLRPFDILMKIIKENEPKVLEDDRQ